MDSKPALKGIAASPGVAEGKAFICQTAADLSGFQEGEIIVTRITDPTMVQAMIRAAGIVTDIGGITSHPAILSREMGIPCVVNTQTATKTIRHGKRVRVDGNTGVVHVLD